MSEPNKITLITFRALINNRIGIIDVKKSQEEEEEEDVDDLIITMEFPTSSDKAYEYMYECSVKTTKFKELLECICNFPELTIANNTNNNFQLKFELEKSETMPYTEEEFLKLPINKIPINTFARLYPKKLN
jgi:hypothetical protein